MIKFLNKVLDFINISKHRIVLQIIYKNNIFISSKYKLSTTWIINPNYKC